jgi:hypothetical protein
VGLGGKRARGLFVSARASARKRRGRFSHDPLPALPSVVDLKFVTQRIEGDKRISNPETTLES